MNFIGTKRKPLEIFVNWNENEKNADACKETNILRSSFRGLQQGFGFSMGMHNLTVCEYGEILEYLEPTKFDVISGLSTLHTPFRMEKAYLGPQSTAKLVRLTDHRGKGRCETLESMIVAHQYVLSTVCQRGMRCDEKEVKPEESRKRAAGSKVYTWSGFRYCVILPPLCGMQDFLRVIDAPIESVTLCRRRSTIYSKAGKFPTEGQTLKSYCWNNTIMSENGCRKEALFISYTLLPSRSSGLFPEKLENLGIYLTVTEEVVRGHSATQGQKGNYYEWVPPVMAGVNSKRVQTFFLRIGCSIVLPSTCVVRIGAHSTDDVVVFIHAVRVTLPEDEKMVFLRRSASYQSEDLDEYSNFTDFLELHYRSTVRYIQWNDFFSNDEQEELGIVGTIPSAINVSMNTELRLQIVQSASSLQLGREGVLDAYRKMPIFRLPNVNKTTVSEDDVVEDGVSSMGIHGEEQCFVDDVPYDYFQFVMGKPLPFPLCLGEVWEADMEEGSDYEERDSLSSSQSSTDTDSEESEYERSE